MEYYIKTILIGSYGCGKTSLFKRLTNDDFKSSHDSTIGVDYQAKIYVKDNISYKFAIWDTAGAKPFVPIIKSYFRGSYLAILIFDLNDQNSFNEMLEWWRIYNEECPNNYVILVGNKKDLINKKSNEINEINYGNINPLTIIEFIKQNKLPYFEISCKTKEGLTDLQEIILNHISSGIKDGSIKLGKNSGVKITSLDKNKYNSSKITDIFKIEEIDKHEKKNKKCCVLL